MACQRYYYQLLSGASVPLGLFAFISTTQVRANIPFPVTMRTTPTIVASSGAYYLLEGTMGGSVSAFGINVANTNAANIYGTTSNASTAGYSSTIYSNNSAGSIAFSAEL